MKNLEFILSFFFLIAIFTHCTSEEIYKQPNVIMISVDDMNDWVSCLNDFQMVETLNMDRLAEMGTLFTNAYCAAPLCNPSRTAIFTGMSPARTGIVNNARDESGAWKLRWPELNTMPLWFKKNGYTVVGGGKTYHETVPELFNPLHQWDEYFPLEIEKFKQKPHLEKLGIKDREWFSDMPSHPNGSWDWGPFFCEDFDMGDGKTTKWAMDFLSKNHDKPFFLALGLFHPHLPFYAPKKYFDALPMDSVKLPEAPDWDLDDLPEGAKKFMRAGNDKGFKMVAESGELKNAIRAYLASIAYVDALVGYLLESLENSKYAENTIIIFWSDHGYQFGEKERFSKRSLWRRSSRVLFTVKAPGITKPEMICKQPVSLLDIYPTLLELCNLPQPGHELDGISLIPQLEDNEKKRRPAVITHEIGNNSVCDEHWTYIQYKDGGEELYDRDVDLNEWKNLAKDSKYKGVISELKKWTPENQGINLKPVDK
ncbi:MAG: sulfatase [Prolixibacteraceae bacterium]|jgi:arylsulfatase A-like enzyme|nr:sulfatase [Prolixibacteraceae bacterium]MBT6763906.1 sulfatase [Prolixibacteraceae bacterium]MBT7394175.1 sulfatase [Prolixibacteraceae bacterium]